MNPSSRPARPRRYYPARFPSAAVVAGSLLIGCSSTPEGLSTQQLVQRMRAASPRCEAGDAAQCAVVCVHGGPNASCQRGCDADDAPSCVHLATRLEKEVDAPDAESAPRSIAPPSPELITDAYEKACKLGVGKGCLAAGSRILNGQGPGKRGSTRAIELLKRGCQPLRDAETCCGLAELNFRMAEAAPDQADVFRNEAQGWTELAEHRGGKCPQRDAGP